MKGCNSCKVIYRDGVSHCPRCRCKLFPKGHPLYYIKDGEEILCNDKSLPMYIRTLGYVPDPKK